VFESEENIYNARRGGGSNGLRKSHYLAQHLPLAAYQAGVPSLLRSKPLGRIGVRGFGEGTMGKHLVKGRLLSLMTAVTLVVGISAVSAVDAGPAGATAAAGAVGAGPASHHSGPLAPCTKPLFGADKDCESTSPVVDRWFSPNGTGYETCVITLYVDWGDGTSSHQTFTDVGPGVYLIASHRYGAQAHTATYTETVTSAIDSGACSAVPTTVFHFTHLKSAAAPWLPGIQLTNECKAELAAELISLGVNVSEALGLFVIPGTDFVGVLILAVDAYLVIRFLDSCVAQSPTSTTDSSTASSTASLPRLPHAFAYGASHPDKRFKPSGKVLTQPQITGIYGYQKGALDYFSLTYANPHHDARGFGFVGINGAGWAEENHPFSSPSYGIVGKDRIDYPFNLLCGTPQQYSSWVEAWIYNSQGLRSRPVEIALTCTT